jgi:hypothetical protein
MAALSRWLLRKAAGRKGGLREEAAAWNKDFRRWTLKRAGSERLLFRGAAFERLFQKRLVARSSSKPALAALCFLQASRAEPGSVATPK